MENLSFKVQYMFIIENTFWIGQTLKKYIISDRRRTKRNIKMGNLKSKILGRRLLL